MREYWNIVQLSYLGEREPSSEIVKVLKKVGGKGTEVFVPAIKGPGKTFKVENFLVDGYVFVKTARDPSCLLKLEDNPLFTQVVTQTEEGERFLNQVSDRSIEDVRQRLDELRDPESIQVEDRVLITDGTYRNMVGVVKEIDEEGMATIYIKLHSKERKPKVPLFCLTREFSDPILR